MERMGKQPDPDKFPIEDWEFPFEVQQAISIHAFLPDRWDGASGSYMGKDWSPITELLNSFNVTEDRNQVIYFTKIIDRFHTTETNDRIEVESKKREQEQKLKAQRGVRTPNITKRNG